MSDHGDRRTAEGVGRLLAFTDAVVAIALTLLILPLVDVTADLQEQTTFGAIVDEHSNAIISFFISFAVIWVLWRHHHRIMEHFGSYDSTLMALHAFWLVTIVILPFATGVLDEGDDVRYGNVFYIGVLMASIVALLLITRWGAAHRELIDEADDGAFDQWVADRDGYGTIITLVPAMIIAAIWPAAGSWPLLLLLLTAPIEGLMRRMSRS